MIGAETLTRSLGCGTLSYFYTCAPGITPQRKQAAGLSEEPVRTALTVGEGPPCGACVRLPEHLLAASPTSSQPTGARRGAPALLALGSWSQLQETRRVQSPN